MAHLVGFDLVRPGRHLEIVPYTATRGEFIAPDKPGNPFNDGSRVVGSTGLDLKARVSSSMTLDVTINPDFGQAEVDPAVVNLSAFETFFEEKRPFFVEGAGYFGFGSLNCFFCSNVSSLGMFYTRRIGRPPQAPDNVDAAGGVYADQPH